MVSRDLLAGSLSQSGMGTSDTRQLISLALIQHDLAADVTSRLINKAVTPMVLTSRSNGELDWRATMIKREVVAKDGAITARFSVDPGAHREPGLDSANQAAAAALANEYRAAMAKVLDELGVRHQDDGRGGVSFKGSDLVEKVGPILMALSGARADRIQSFWQTRDAVVGHHTAGIAPNGRGGKPRGARGD